MPEDDFAVLSPSSIRQNFSDYAFWEPELITDSNGKVSFDVTFPDDITNWQTIVLGMTSDKQSGQTAEYIKSYKPLMAQLTVPRFLIRQDTSYAIGKTVNYQADSVSVTTSFEVNDVPLQVKQAHVRQAVIDTLLVVAGSDSLSVKYTLKKEDGYFDGEIREIPVYRKGMETTDGAFHVLDKDTTITLSFDSSKGDVTLYAQSDVLDVMENEIRHIRDYRYYCNEQIASKLHAALALYQMDIFYKRSSSVADDIKKLIKRLEKNQKPNGLWGWWKNSSDNYWISLHILNALNTAKATGFEVRELQEASADKFIWDLENIQSYETRLRMLEILHLQNQVIGYKEYIQELEKAPKQSLNYKLRLLRLRQQRQLPYSLDTLHSYQSKSLFGNIFYTEKDLESTLINNDIENTLIAYSILQNHPKEEEEIKLKIRNYLLEKRGQGYWRNTYESSRIVSTLVPEFIDKPSGYSKTELTLVSDSTQVFTEFPLEMTFSPDLPLQVAKKGDFPVYFTAFQKYWVEEPTATKADFEIKSWFDQNPKVLEAGREVRLLRYIKMLNMS